MCMIGMSVVNGTLLDVKVIDDDKINPHTVQTCVVIATKSFLMWQSVVIYKQVMMSIALDEGVRGILIFASISVCLTLA